MELLSLLLSQCFALFARIKLNQEIVIVNWKLHVLANKLIDQKANSAVLLNKCDCLWVQDHCLLGPSYPQYNTYV